MYTEHFKRRQPTVFQIRICFKVKRGARNNNGKSTQELSTENADVSSPSRFGDLLAVGYAEPKWICPSVSELLEVKRRTLVGLPFPDPGNSYAADWEELIRDFPLVGIASSDCW